MDQLKTPFCFCLFIHDTLVQQKRISHGLKVMCEKLCLSTKIYSEMNLLSCLYITLSLYVLSLGVNCEINEDDCASNPCGYGECHDGINEYKCVCAPGYTGRSLIENAT